MQLVRRETPFGSPPRSGKRALYHIDDPFLRLWFRTVAPNRAMLGTARSETRLGYWRSAWPALIAKTWEALCRRAVPMLHRGDSALGRFGPWFPAQRYWHGNAPELDIVARSLDGKRLLVGEAKWTERAGRRRRAARPTSPKLPDTDDCEIVYALFVPEAVEGEDEASGTHLVSAKTVMAALR